MFTAAGHRKLRCFSRGAAACADLARSADRYHWPAARTQVMNRPQRSKRVGLLVGSWPETAIAWGVYAGLIAPSLLPRNFGVVEEGD